MKITLILAAAPNDPLKQNDPFMPLSLPLLAASSPNHDYTFVDMLAGEKPNFGLPTDLVGISARITAEKTAFEIADRYRQKGVTVVLGGAQASSSPLRAAEHADAVATGEGEGVWPILLDDFQKGELKRFYSGSGQSLNVDSASIFQSDDWLDLSTINDAIQTRALFRKKYVFNTVFAARGCAVGCDFCSVGNIFGKKTRLRPIDDVVREIESFKKFYYILDDTVFGRPNTYAYYSNLYDRIGKLKKVNYWTGQANLDAALSSEGRDVIKKAADSGLIYAAIGMESINPSVMKKAGTMSKNGSGDHDSVVDQMRSSIRFIQDQGIAVSGWFTIGYEEDSIDTFYETLKFCEETNIIPVLCPLEALPGTPLHNRLMTEGRLDNNKKINVIHPSMTDNDILAALKDCTQKGFSLKQIYNRTQFFKRSLANISHHNNVDTRAVIEKTIFIFVLQLKLKKGVIGLANTGSSV